MSEQASGSFVTPVYRTSRAATAAFPGSATGGPIEPNGVGICLSGGGSRAMGAGIGQLQALEQLTSGSGSLLSQVLAMSTVSGGGWVGVPFTYLPASFSDDQFLGSYTAPANLTEAIINASPAGWIGGQVSSGFSIPDLATKAVYLYDQGVPSSMLWQTLMGLHFLQPYGLFPIEADFQPNTLFSFDQSVLYSQVTGPNPALSEVPAYLVAQVSGQARPYLLSVASMFVKLGADKMLVPVQSTPYLAGILPTPEGALDVNTRPVGGGGVGSFGFNSVYLASVAGGSASVQQSRQWSLMDIMGTSSAAFAAEVEKLLAEWSRSPERFAAALRVYKDSAAESLARAGRAASEVAARLEAIATAAETGGFDAIKGQLGALGPLGVLGSLVPKYDYWAPGSPPPATVAALQDFADGGSLDNTGITSMLFYPDVSRIIAFVNTETALTQDRNGTIVINPNIPPLFGLQAHSDKTSPPYAPAADAPASDLTRLNQVFPTDAFQPLLDGLWKSIGGSESMAPIFTQQLTTVENSWFGIPAGREVTLLWVYLGMSQVWRKEINDLLVRARVEYEEATEHFPHYATLLTQRTPAQMNLLSSLTAWTVLENKDAFTALFS